MRDYNAIVEVSHRPGGTGIDNDLTDKIFDNLAVCSPALSISERGWLEITITLPAESLADAITTALDVVKAATRSDVVSIAATATDEFDRRIGLVPRVPDDLISVTEAAEILGVSRQAVMDRINRKTLPARKVGREYVLQRAALSA